MYKKTFKIKDYASHLTPSPEKSNDKILKKLKT